MTPLCMTIQRKATIQDFIVLYKVTPAFRSVDETLLCNHSKRLSVTFLWPDVNESIVCDHLKESC